jgi:hypothetical protein
MSSPPAQPIPRRRVPWKRILISFGIAMCLTVVIIEVMSRVADGLLASKRREPSFDLKSYQPGFLDKLSLATLEYGTVKRAGEQSNARNVPHPYLGYALTPGYETPPGAKLQAAHNALGFRGKETTWE